MRRTQRGITFIAVVALLFSVFIQPLTILAKELNQTSIVDSIDLSKTDLRDGEHVKFTVSFSEKPDMQIENGDTLTLDLPHSDNGYIHGFRKTFDLTDENGKVLGKVNVAEEKVIITFNSTAASLDNVKGQFYFTAEARNLENSAEGSTITFDTNFGVANLPKQTISIERGPDVGGDYPPYYKVGGMYTEDTNHVKWWLNFNLNGNMMQEDAYIEDKVMPGHDMDWSTFEVAINNEYPSLSKEEFEQQGYGKIEYIDGNPDHFYIHIYKDKVQNASLVFSYKTTIVEEEQDSFENQSKIWYNFGENQKADAEESNDTVANIFAGGGAEGDLRKKEVKFSKQDGETNQPLAGAKLQIYDTTDDKEVATFTSTTSLKTLTLAKGHYYELREVQAPKGYKKAEPITFRVTAYGLVETKQADGSYKKVDNFTVVMKDLPETRQVSLFKVGSDKPNEGLAGAKLQLKDLTLNKVTKEWTTTTEKQELSVVYGHEYELSEIQAPAGYDIADAIIFKVNKDGTIVLKDDEGHDIPLRGNTLTMVDHKKAPEKTNVYIKKLAQDEVVPVVGATLKIVDAKTNEEVVTWQTGTMPKKLPLENGKSYILKEVDAPDGYLLAKDIAFSLTDDGKVMVDNKEVTSATLTMIDLRKEVTKKVLKVNEEGKPLSGVTFLLRNRSTHLIEKEFTTTTNPTDITLKAGHVYDLIEKEPLPGYESIDPVVLLVKKDGTLIINGQVVHDDTIKIENVRLKKDVSFAKRDDETKSLLSGATLKITNLTTKETIEWQTEKEITNQTLKYDCYYRLEEVKAPNGYQLAAPIDFVIRADGRVQVKKGDSYVNVSDNLIEMFDQRQQKEVPFEKKDKLTQAFVPGAKLQLHDLTNDTLVNWTSTTKDKPLTLTYGHRYELIEMEAPTGYTRAKSLMIEVTMTGEVMVDGQPMEKVTLYNERKTANVPFKKVDEFGQFVQGATIEMTNKTTGNVTTITNSEATVTLHYGMTYEFNETKVPVGYEKADPVTVEVTMEGKIMVNGQEMTDAIEMVDPHQTKELWLEKRDNQSKLFLQGASFTLVDQTTGKEERWISTMDKKALHLTYGHRYELKEIQAPSGYRLTQPISLDVTMEGEVYIDGELYTSDTYVIYNRRLDEPLQFKKVDESGKVLKGAKMTLYNISAHTATSFETTDEPIELPLKQRQVYRLEEDEAPAGYQLADPIVIMITDTGKVLVNHKEYPYDTIKMVDLSLKKEVLLEKRDIDTKLPLADAKLAVEDEAGNRLTEWTSTKDAHLLELDYGKTYILKEIEAPKGYKTAEPLRFKIETDGVIYIEKDGQWIQSDRVTLYNQRQTKEVPFKKMDELNQLVHGAVITVKNMTTGETYDVNTSEEKLVLSYGTTYVLQETKVPTGYQKAEPLTVEVTMSGEVMVNGQKADTIAMVDLRKEHEVTVSKQDEKSHERLEGAVLAIRDLNTGDIVTQWTSERDANQTIHLPWGHRYAVEEVQAPVHYNQLSHPIEFTITQDGKLMVDGKEQETLVVNNQRKEHEVVIHKYMTKTNLPVNGAKLVLRHDDQQYEFTTKEAGERVTLNEGVTYHLSEKEVPVGFAQAKPLTLMINESGKLEVNGQETDDNHVVMEDTPLMYIAKRDAITNVLLSDAKLRVMNKKTQKTVVTFKTSQALTQLPILEQNIEYQLIEDEAPIGYQFAHPITFKFDSNWNALIWNGKDWEKQSERLVTMYDEPQHVLPPSNSDSTQSSDGENVPNDSSLDSPLSGETHAKQDETKPVNDKINKIPLRANQDGSLPIVSTPHSIMPMDMQPSRFKYPVVNAGVPQGAYPTEHSGKLPTTGNKVNHDIMWLGVILVGLSLASMTYYRFKRN